MEGGGARYSYCWRLHIFWDVTIGFIDLGKEEFKETVDIGYGELLPDADEA